MDPSALVVLRRAAREHRYAHTRRRGIGLRQGGQRARLGLALVAELGAASDGTKDAVANLPMSSRARVAPTT